MPDPADPAAGPSAEGSGEDRVAMLQRWEAFGAVWRVVGRDEQAVTVALCRCDGGEEVERFRSADPRLLEFITSRTQGSIADRPEPL